MEQPRGEVRGGVGAALSLVLLAAAVLPGGAELDNVTAAGYEAATWL
jgi:hypothetical protein